MKMKVKLDKCGTCLCSDRQLVCLSKIQSIITEIQLTQVLRMDGGVCWECHTNIVKFFKFRIQVKQAQEILTKNTEHQLISLSALSKKTKQNYDFEYTYYYDPISTNQESYEVKAEPIMIKQEANEIDLDYRIHSDTDEEPLPKVFADIIEIKNIARNKRILHKKKTYLKQDTKKSKDLKKKRNNLKEDLKKDNNLNRDLKNNNMNGLKNEIKAVKEDLKKENNNLNRDLKKKNNNKNGLKNEINELKEDLKTENNSLNRDLKKKNRNVEECLKEDTKLEIDKEVLKAKFETILFTEEEMLKCREEKRNQANFKKIPFKCVECVTGFTKKENYHLHLLKQHDESIGAHACSVCHTRFASESTLTRHHTRHYLQYRCRLCAYKVSSAKAAIKHGRVKHAGDKSDRIHCKLCAFVARTSKELSEHRSSNHSLVCNQCGVNFKGRNTLRAHQMRIHSVKREFTCDSCSRTFMNKSRLETHMTRHGDVIAKRLAYCAPCRVQYKDIHVYRNHLRNSVYHVQDRITCPDCGKKFASRVYWSKHYKYYHLRQSRYKCEDCDKLFISEWRLKIHRQTHHGLARTRDHACAECGNKFYTKATLLTHSLLHAASRAFMCARCGDTFRQRAALYTHARLVHPQT